MLPSSFWENSSSDVNIRSHDCRQDPSLVPGASQVKFQVEPAKVNMQHTPSTERTPSRIASLMNKMHCVRIVSGYVSKGTGYARCNAENELDVQERRGEFTNQ